MKNEPLEVIVTTCQKCDREYSILGFTETTGKQNFFSCSKYYCDKVRVTE